MRMHTKLTLIKVIEFLVLFQWCTAVDIAFKQEIGDGIKRIEILSCEREPCVITKEIQLPVKITFQTPPKSATFPDITDATVRVFFDWYRNLYQLVLVRHNSLCNEKMIDCPLMFNTRYTVDLNLFIPFSNFDGTVEDLGSRKSTGIREVVFDISLSSSTGGALIGDAIATVDVHNLTTIVS